MSREPKNTIQLLAEMTDSGAFERLATAVLRIEQPAGYHALAHPGMNSEGKTVRSPVDGIAVTEGADDPLIVAAHHTICGIKELRGKWLDSKDGDLAKTVAIVAEERLRTPSAQAVLALTTNREPSQELVRDVVAEGAKHGMTVDIWSVSRIAHVLDFTPDGQWVRRKYLGVPQERVSRELLAELSAQSMREYPHLFDDPALWVDRTLYGELALALEEARDVLFLVAGSGLGKSSACYRTLGLTIERGRWGLVISHDMVMEAATPEAALERALRRLCPSLAQGCGLQALSLCSPDAPFLMIVEDVNKATQPINVVERIAGWASADRRGDKGRPLWRLLTPVWPQVLAGLREDSRKLVDTLSLFGGTLTPEEGQAAVRQRARSAGQQLSDLQASMLSSALGHDPLLLALHEFAGAAQPANANLVISKFVSERLAKIADTPGAPFTASDLKQALRSLGRAMLHKRCLSPTWNNLREWLVSEQDFLSMLKAVCGHRELLRLLPLGDNESLDFRHDRIRDWLLADVVAAMMKNGGVPPGILEEPYWAEIIGAALVHWDAIPDDWAERVRAANPLALFHAFQQFGLPTGPIHRAILLSIDAWLKDPPTHDQTSAHLRWEVQRALADTDSPLVLKISAGFPERSWALDEARFRNGDLLAGVNFCQGMEPGLRYPRRDHLIAHVMENHGAKILKELDRLLRHPFLTSHGRRGALYLAGHIGRSELYDALSACWEASADRSQELDAFLWAAARSAPESGAEALLDPVCELWGLLPDQVEGEEHSSPRFDLVEFSLKFAFWRGLPSSAVRYFIERAPQEDLRRIIVYALHGLDRPDVLEFVTRELAAIAREIEGTGWIAPLADQIRWHWNSPFNDSKRMSVASRSRLLQLWQPEGEDKFVLRNAFWLWAGSTTKDDFPVLRSLPPTSVLYDDALVTRLKAGDRAAIPELLTKLSTEDDCTYWWQFARHIWCDELTMALEGQLEKRRGVAPRDWNQSNNTDWITSELLMRLGGASAAGMLERHWDHLRYSSNFVHAALYVATDKTRALAAEALEACPSKKDLLHFVTGHFGVGMTGRPGVVEVGPIDSLIPYLDYLEEMEIYSLWHLCRDRGWFEWRRAHLDHRFGAEFRPRGVVSEEGLLANLDEFLDDRRSTSWIGDWLERLIEKDRLSIDCIMAAVRTWLDARRSMSAFRIAAEILAQGGRRTDLHILDVDGIEPGEEVVMLHADTCFATCRRTLV